APGTASRYHVARLAPVRRAWGGRRQQPRCAGPPPCGAGREGADVKTYRAAVIGCSRMGGFIDNEVVGSPAHVPPYSHGAGFFACERTELVACADLRADVLAAFGRQYQVPAARQYLDYRELIDKEQPD